MQEKEQEDEQDKVKDKDQEYGYDQEYKLTSAVLSNSSPKSRLQSGTRS